MSTQVLTPSAADARRVADLGLLGVVVVLALDVVWPRLRAQRPQQVVGLAVVGFALLGLYRANSSDPVGEAHTDGMRPEISAALACDSGRTLYVEGQLFYPLYAAAYAQGIVFRTALTERDGLPVEIPYGTGWFNGLISPRDWDVFTMKDACGADRTLIRDRRRWTLPDTPDARLDSQLEALKTSLGVESLQVIRLPPEPVATSTDEPPTARCPMRR